MLYVQGQWSSNRVKGLFLVPFNFALEFGVREEMERESALNFSSNAIQSLLFSDDMQYICLLSADNDEQHLEPYMTSSIIDQLPSAPTSSSQQLSVVLNRD